MEQVVDFWRGRSLQAAAETATAGSEEGLVRQAAGGDSAAFERLYRLNIGRVYAVCRRMCGDDARAEELAQDVFVRAWEKLGTFRGESAFSSWLHRLAVNVTLQELRSQRRREQRVSPEEDLDWLGATAVTSDVGTRLDLERAMAGLPAGARTVFVLHVIEGYRHDEIAELLGVTTGTAKAQLHRARQLLRKAMA